ncbi:SAP domain-containing protein [Ditylenchus destructor]|nr:SAP domain-containing protein [Ditylenchus destructor]
MDLDVPEHNIDNIPDGHYSRDEVNASSTDESTSSRNTSSHIPTIPNNNLILHNKSNPTVATPTSEHMTISLNNTINVDTGVNLEKESTYDRLLEQQEILLQWQNGGSSADEAQQEEDHRRDTDHEDEVDNTNVETPPCLLYNDGSHPESTASENSPGDQQLHTEAESSNEDHQLKAKCCQCVDINNQNTGDNAPSSTTMDPIGDCIRSRLMEFKVQDLKKECRKRQLAASGTKDQILDRLKPFEETVFAEFLARNVVVSSCPAAKTPRAHTGSGLKSKTFAKKLGPSQSHSTIESIIEAVASNSKANRQKDRDGNGDTSKLGPPIRDVINDYLQHHHNSQSGHNWISSLQQKPNCCANNRGQSSSLSSKLAQLNVAFDKPPTQNVQQQCGSHCCRYTHAKETPAHSASSHSGRNSEMLESNALIQNSSPGHHSHTLICGSDGRMHKLPESTFSFAQMGSGGQFTLAETSSNQHSQSGIRPSPHSESRQSGLSLPPLQYGQQKFSSNNDSVQHSGHRQPAESEFSNSFEMHREFTGNQAPTLQQTRHGCVCCRDNVQQLSNYESQRAVHSHQNQQSFYPEHEESHSQDCDSGTNHTLERASAAPVRRRHSYDCQTNSENEDNQRLPKPLHFDPADPNTLLTPSTLSNHEETLRYQQKKIQELQRELSRSQYYLRQQQQMIWMAKRAQVHRDAYGRPQTQAEYWIDQLDVKNLRNNHIQNILEHKSQQQQFHNQAVQDIVRLIKQDFRSSLLIVQLVRKYQLERSPEQQHLDINNQQSLYNNEEDHCNIMESNQQVTPNKPQFGLTQDHNNMEIPINTNAMNLGCPPIRPIRSCDCSPNSGQQHEQDFHLHSGRPCCKPSSKDDLVILNEHERTTAGQQIETNLMSRFTTYMARSRKSKLSQQQRSGWQPRSNSVTFPSGNRGTRRKTMTAKRHSNTSVNSSENCGNPPVDMEEIFRTVLEETKQNGNTKSKPKKKHITDMDNILLGNGKKIRRRRMVRTGGGNEGINENQESHMQNMSQYQKRKMNGEKDYPESICSSMPEISSGKGRSHPSQHVINSTSLDIDCFNKSNSHGYAACLNSLATTDECRSDATFEYTKNHAFDDLMDVLRDDQEKSILGLSERTPSSNDYSLGYTSDELIGFLADDDPDFYPIFNSAQNHTHVYNPAPNYQREQSLHQNQPNGLEFNSGFDSHSIVLNHHQFHQHHNSHQHHSNGSNQTHFQTQSQNSQSSNSHAIIDANDIIPPNSNGDLSISSCSTTISQQSELHNIVQQDGVNKSMFDFSTMARDEGIQDQEMEWFDDMNSILDGGSIDSSLHNSFANKNFPQQSMNALV